MIRELTFRKGINLVVDETTTNDRRESGNNVGKTTVLRLIDFCLGSDGKNIYRDPEFRQKTNSQIEKFLTENNVIITLVLQEDLALDTSRTVTIRRNFLARKYKILEVDGECVKVKDFQGVLRERIFSSSGDKPTFRQIISKNVRDEKNRLVNTVKVLHPNSKAEEYEALYLFWLGIDLDSSQRKQKLILKKRIEEDLQKHLRKESTLSLVIQSLLVVNRSITELEKRKDELGFNEKFESDIRKLDEVKSEINRLSTRQSRLKLRSELIAESIAELDKEFSDIDVHVVQALYEEASQLLPRIQKTFEETLEFHNGMIGEKKRYISDELPKLDRELMEIEQSISGFLAREKEMSMSLVKADAMAVIEELVTDLNEAHESKGKLEEQKRIWEASIKNLEEINSGLKDIEKGIDSLEGTIQERIADFNVFFSQVSAKLYGEKYVLSADKNNSNYELNISSIVGNPGTGKKKGEMAAFDIAYIKFADRVGIDCLHFILQDQIENIHDNQITSLFAEIVENSNCQYVLPVLRDKLPNDVAVSKYEIISLSQEDKLFRV